MDEFGELKGRSQQQLKAIARVRELLLSGEYKAGERLTELGLADKLGISRTPIRLALSALEREGLLEPIASGGFSVRSFTLEDVYDAIEIRGILEGTAARMAAERPCTREQIAEFGKISKQMQSLMSIDMVDDEFFDVYGEINIRFHELLLEASGSPMLIRTAENIVKLPFVSPSSLLKRCQEGGLSRELLYEGMHQHLSLMEAIIGRQGSRAEALARERAWRARSIMKETFKEAEIAQNSAFVYLFKKRA